MYLVNKYAVLIFLLSLIFGCTIPGSYLTKDMAGNNNILDVNFHLLTSNNISKFAKTEIIPQVNPELDSVLKNYQYRVGSGDILNILVWEHPELKMPTRYLSESNNSNNSIDSGTWVQQDGTIFYPYVGTVYVKDKTVKEIREIMTDLLKKYIESPQVDVNVIAFRSKYSYITGEVNRPGKQPLTNIPLTLLDAINQAGGLAAEADWSNVILSRRGKEINVSLLGLMQYGDMNQNHLLAMGDIVHVPRNDSQKIFVMGEVQKPQLLKMDRMGMSLTEALSLAGGINQFEADATGVFILRRGTKFNNNQLNQIADVYQLNIKDASALVLGTQFELEPKDIVYVTAAPIARWNRVIRQLLPTVIGFNNFSDGFREVNNW